MSHFLVRLAFLLGVFIGVVLAILCIYLQNNANKQMKQQVPFQQLYEEWFRKTGAKRKIILLDDAIYGVEDYYLEAHFLKDRISVMCIIFKQKEEYTEVALLTWVKQCNNVTVIDVIKKKKMLPSKGDRDQSRWTLLCQTLRTMPINDIMWFLIVNDDSIALIENLRYMVGGLNHSVPYYLGDAVQYWGVTYNSGQAGYVLSQGTLKQFQNKFNHSKDCRMMHSVWAEDLYLGQSLARFNTTPIDTRDENFLTTFQGYPIMRMLNYSYVSSTSVYPTKCCSPHSITVKISGKHGALAYYYYTTKLFPFQGGSLGNVPYKYPAVEQEVVEGVFKFYGSERKNATKDEYYDFWVKLLGTYGIFTEEVDNETL